MDDGTAGPAGATPPGGTVRASGPGNTPAGDAPAGAGAVGAGAVEAGAVATMPVPLLVLDGRGRVRYANAAAEALLGTAVPELLDCAAPEVVWPAAREAVAAAWAGAVAAGAPVTGELPVPAPGDRWVEVCAWPVPEGTAVCLLDVTSRQQACAAAERAQQAAERAGARMALLAAVTAELSGALDGVSALGSLARLVVPALADGCIVTVVDREGRARDVGSWHTDPARRDLVQRYAAVRLHTLPAASPVARALRAGTGATESVEALLGLMQPGPAHDLLTALGHGSVVVLPLTAEDRTVGVLTLYLDPGRTLDEEDLAAAGEVAAAAGRAVDRVHRQSQQAQLAESLQRSLLTEPPVLDAGRIAVRYVPAAEAARVGGDWYDAFPHADGGPVLVIGDVVGHDTAAAAEMGQLRGLLRGIAHYSGAGPAEVLRGLDAAMVQLHPGAMATAVIARLERDGTALCWANAGHPPPVVVDPDGSVRVLSCGMGDLMLGIDPTVQRREFVAPVQRGATVLLYTDGLVERRGSSVDEGLARLCAALTELPARPLDRLCDGLLARMLPGTPEDDVALVALAVEEPGGPAAVTETSPSRGVDAASNG